MQACSDYRGTPCGCFGTLGERGPVLCDPILFATTYGWTRTFAELAKLHCWQTRGLKIGPWVMKRGGGEANTSPLSPG